MLIDAFDVEIFGIIVFRHRKSPSFKTSHEVYIEFSLDLLARLDLRKDGFSCVDSLLAWKFADVGQDPWQKLAIFYHDDGLDIPIPNELIQHTKVLLFEV